MPPSRNFSKCGGGKAKSNRFRQNLNAAFADAHGISASPSSFSISDPTLSFLPNSSHTHHQSASIKNAIISARTTGKLFLVDEGLKLSVLPDEIFDLRSDLKDVVYDMSSDNDQNQGFRYAEGDLVTLDLSDNKVEGTDEKVINVYEKERFIKEHKDVSIPSWQLDLRIKCYTSLTVLRLKRCYLKELPWQIFSENLVNLTILDASHNKLKYLPLDILPFSLKEILLSENKIDLLKMRVNKDMVRMDKLAKLDLSNNILSDVPQNIAALNLRCLDLSNNFLKHIPRELMISCIKSLESLNVSNNKLVTESDGNEFFDWDFSHHIKLQVVELHQNRLTQIPFIRAGVIRLGLNSNNISSIDGLLLRTEGDDITHSKLQELHIEQNHLKTLDIPTLTVLLDLRILNVSHNSLQNLPFVLGYLPQLRRIILTGNPLRMIRHTIRCDKENGSECDTDALKVSLRKKGDPPRSLIAEGICTLESSQKQEAKNIVNAAATGACDLNMSGKKIEKELSHPEIMNELAMKRTSIDKRICIAGDCIRSWNLSKNKISKINERWIELLRNIKTFDISENKLESLPNNLKQLSLEKFVCAQNRLTSSAIRNNLFVHSTEHGSNLACHLVHLDISANNLEWIPGELFNFTALSTLNLSFNKISSLTWKDDEISGIESGWKHGLVALEHLDLSNNKISDLGYLPLALIACQSLRSLFLNSNNISKIPLELGLLEQLTTISIRANPSRTVRTEILESRSCSKILQYLAGRMNPRQLKLAYDEHTEIRSALSTDQSCEKKSLNEGGVDVNRENFLNVGKNLHENIINTRAIPKIDESMSVSKLSCNNDIIDTNSSLKPKVNNKMSSPLTEELEKEIRKLTLELESFSLSEPMKYAKKKKLAIQRSKLIKEDRRLKESG